MALRTLMLKKQIDTAKKQLDALREKDAEFDTRQAELEADIEEAESDEEKAAVEEAIEQFDADKAAHEQEKADLEGQIADLERSLEEAEEPQPEPDPVPEPEFEERKDNKNMSTRDKVFAKMSLQERSALIAREDVQAFIKEIRSAISEKRALNNVGVTIPEVMLGILRENIENYSKLYSRVYLRSISGEGRQPISGAVPEAVWTECCANLNELDLDFADVELGCWKVGGFFKVCNAVLEDSDIDLAAEILNALGQAIGKALDKAILYGTGTRMPLGIVTRLAQTAEPAGYPVTARAWTDLHTSNIKTTSSTGPIELFQDIITYFGEAKGNYSSGTKTWVMNEKTYTKLVAQALGVNAAGAIVSGINSVMPVLGGDIVVLNFVPDDNIIAGYFDNYTLAERAGQKFASSEHYRFLNDETVFKGTARYDGQPAIAEAFVLIAIGGSAAGTSVEFPQDEANGVNTLLITPAATVKAGETIQLTAFTAPGTADVTWTSATTGKATIDANGVVTGVAAGTSVITAACNGLTATCTVTVTSA